MINMKLRIKTCLHRGPPPGLRATNVGDLLTTPYLAVQSLLCILPFSTRKIKLRTSWLWFCLVFNRSDERCSCNVFISHGNKVFLQTQQVCVPNYTLFPT